MKIGFIGAGNMASAIFNGILNSDIDAELFAYDIMPEAAIKLAGENAKNSIKEVVTTCDYIFLAVKPQNFTEVISEISTYYTDEKVIVSILAGIKSRSFKEILLENAKIVITMPNTPLLLGKGCTAVARIAPITDSQFDFVMKIFNSCGDAFELPENLIDEVIPINGSAPAFIYLYAKLFAENASKYGIDYDLAVKMFSKSLIGSAQMITETGESLDTLIERVSSKGGITIEGSKGLLDAGIEKAVADCYDNCVKRAKELAK